MVQQQVVRDRSTVFLMMSRLLTDKLDLVKNLSTMFTLTFIQAGDNETDPRNLLVIFTTKLRILQTLDVEHHTEEIFESLAAYFPVDFTPPSGVVASVTKQHLQESLRAAITHPSLTEWTIGLLLEKLDSDLESAKIDSLETLIELSRQSEDHRQDVIQHWTKEIANIWQGLKVEIMGLRMQTNSKISKVGGQAVTQISKLLGSRSGLETGDTDEAWTKWWSVVWADCRQGLSQPGTRLIQSAASVLDHVVASGHRQAAVVLVQVLPVCVQLLDQDLADSARRDVLLLTGQLLASAAGHNTEVSQDTGPHLDKIFAIFLANINHPEAALAVCKSGGLLSEKQQNELGQSLLAAIKEERPGLGAAVAELVKWNRTLVETEVVPTILTLGTDTSLDCVGHLWRVGLYHVTLSSLVDTLTTSHHQVGAKIIKILSEYEPSDQDKDNIKTLVPHIIRKLMKDTCPSWPVTDQESMCTLLSNLASVLTVDTWASLVADLDMTGDVDVYTASVMSSVTRDIVTSWTRDTLQHLVSQNTEHSWRCVTSIVNKCPELAGTVDIGDTGVGWVTIGLVKRGDGSGADWVTRLVSLLDTDAGHQVVDMVTKTLEPHWWRHPTIGVLYKQRLWSQLLPGLSRGNSSRHVSALVLCLPHLPPPVVSSSLSTVLPRVVSALSNQDTCHAALKCLDTMTSTSPHVITTHLTEIVHHCLDISQQSVSVEARILSLSVLSHCSSIDGTTSVQLASKVTRDLRPVLADRKRLVRLEAAKTRNKWFLVTQPS